MARFPPSRKALGLLALLSAAPSVGAPPAPRSLFVLTNEAQARGVHFVEKNFATDTKYPFETLGVAVAAFDYDRDGFVDLLFLNGAPSPEHLRTNDPATFNRLFRNAGKGQFVDVTQESGLSGAGIKGTHRASPWATTTTTAPCRPSSSSASPISGAGTPKKAREHREIYDELVREEKARTIGVRGE